MNILGFGNIFGTKTYFRITVLAAIAILATAMLSGAYFFGDQIMHREAQKLSKFILVAGLAQDVKSGALQMRRREKDFLLRKDKQYIEKYIAEAKKVEQALAQIVRYAAADTVQPKIKQVEEAVAQHKKTFLNVVELMQQMGLNEKLGLQGKLRAAVHNVEVKLKAANLDKLTVKMLMMRRHEKDFMLRGQQEYILSIDKRHEEFNAMLKETALPGNVKLDMVSLMDAYQNGIRSYARIALILQLEIKKLSRIFAQMTPEVESVYEVSQVSKQKAETSLSDARTMTKKVFLGMVIYVLATSIGLGLLIGKNFS